MYIREWLFGVLFFPLVMGCQNMSQITEEVVVNLRQKGTDISSSMYGVFFEEINHAGDGGLNWYRTEVLKKMKSLKGIG